MHRSMLNENCADAFEYSSIACDAYLMRHGVSVPISTKENAKKKFLAISIFGFTKGKLL